MEALEVLVELKWAFQQTSLLFARLWQDFVENCGDGDTEFDVCKVPVRERRYEVELDRSAAATTNDFQQL